MTDPAGPRLERLGERSRNPHRLGRHIHHDPQSLAYAAPVLPRAAIQSQAWTRRIGVLDQDHYVDPATRSTISLGSCTGNAAAYWAGTDNATRQGLTEVAGRPVDEAFAVDLYETATRLDEFPGQYPPEDTGSSGLAAAKALQLAGLAVSYRHAFTLQALQSAMQDGPVMVGVPWFGSMFSPDGDGLVPVDPESGLAGGHELCLTDLDMQAGRVGFTNSWGPDWGAAGRGWFTFDDLAALLRQDGDVTVPVPAPTINPAPPRPAGCLPGLIRRRRTP